MGAGEFAKEGEGGRPAKLPLLLVEDDEALREQLKWTLSSDYTVLEAQDRRTALAVFKRESPGLVLLDLGLPPEPDGSSEGLATLTEMLEHTPPAKVVVVTGNTDRGTALAAVQGGAYDFIEKPPQPEVLKVVLQRAEYLRRLEQEHQRLQEQAEARGLEEIIGVSPPMLRVFEVVRRVAGSDVPVLITGESGTGKELVARAIHNRSQRKGGQFVAINCGAIPETLLESELFGYEKGAFTGAHRQQKGKLEYADGGTLFLDEIGEMPLALQVKLLRFLQDGRLERVGGREELAVDARVLAATNVDPLAAIQQGRFREDLYYRLNVVRIDLPPLRERGEDIVLLAQSLVSRYRETLNPRVTSLSEEAIEAIRAYAWPGNVRELENRVKRAVILARSSQIRPGDLEVPWEGRARPTRTLKEARAQLEKELMQQALVYHDWNISRAAEDLGISRQTLHEAIQKYGLKKPGSGPADGDSRKAS